MKTKIKVSRCKLGRQIAKKLYPIIGPQNINVGYGPFQLRPDGSRDIRAEERVLAKLVQKINGLSGQQTG